MFICIFTKRLGSDWEWKRTIWLFIYTKTLHAHSHTHRCVRVWYKCVCAVFLYLKSQIVYGHETDWVVPRSTVVEVAERIWIYTFILLKKSSVGKGVDEMLSKRMLEAVVFPNRPDVLLKMAIFCLKAPLSISHALTHYPRLDFIMSNTPSLQTVWLGVGKCTRNM